MAGLLELARPCSISGAVKVDTSSDRPQFLKAKVPVADSSREAGLMILDILFRPGGGGRGDVCTVFESVTLVIMIFTFTSYADLDKY